jgi:hypothetical protein
LLSWAIQSSIIQKKKSDSQPDTGWEGCRAESRKKISAEEYRQQLMKVSVWSDEDIKALEHAGDSIKFKPAEW